MALEALYHSGGGDDFIWGMFENDSKKISGLLAVYAFFIGARRLSSEDFYDTFFKTGIYEKVAKHDRYAFKSAFLGNETEMEYGYYYNSRNARKYPEESLPELSDAVRHKIVRYFMYEIKGHDHINLVCQMVSPDDTEILDLLAGRLSSELTKNSYSYSNYLIIKLLGETRHKNFKKLYGLFREKSHYTLVSAAKLIELDILERDF